MSLVSNEGDSEQNEIRNLQEKLESTMSLVKQLSGQLAELKEQVSVLRETELGGVGPVHLARHDPQGLLGARSLFTGNCGFQGGSPPPCCSNHISASGDFCSPHLPISCDPLPMRGGDKEQMPKCKDFFAL